MDKEKQTKIKELADIYKDNQEEIASDILNVFKKDSKNYGELRQQVKQLERGLLYTNSDKCTSLIWEINELLEKEMNDLPLTSRSTEKVQDALNQLSQGKVTINQIRKEYGLNPIKEGDSFMEHVTKE